MTGHIVQLDAARSRSLTVRGDKQILPRSRRRFDGFPLGRGRAGVHIRVSSVVIRNDLKLAPYKADARNPFPDVAVQVADAIELPIVPPAQRAGASEDAGNSAAVTHTGDRNGLIDALCGVLAVVIVAFGLSAVLLAPEGQKRPLCRRDAVMTEALVPAILLVGIKVNADHRVHTGEAVNAVGIRDALVLADVDARLLHATHAERGVNGIIPASQQSGQLLSADLHIEAGHPLIIGNHLVAGADCRQRETGCVKVRHSVFPPVSYLRRPLMAHRVRVTSDISSGMTSAGVNRCCIPPPSPFSLSAAAAISASSGSMGCGSVYFTAGMST